MRQPWLFAFLFACSAAPALAADATVLNYETTDLQSKQIQAGSMYFGDNRLKIVTAAQAGLPSTEMIYRGDRELVWIVDHKQKSYIQMDRQTMNQMAERFSGVYKQLEAQLAQLPPEQREQAERMLHKQGPEAPKPAPTGELKKIGETREINGYVCVRYDFYLNGRRDTELWVTRDSALNFSSMAQLLRSMGEFYSGLTRNLPGNSRARDFDFQALSNLDGFPVLIRNFDGDVVTSETQIRNIRRERVARDFFEAPEGYQAASASPPRAMGR